MATRWLKLTVAYDGTDYAGWQVQPDKPTVQGAIEAAWREITLETVRVTAAGRTDAGVHALGQVVAVATETQLATSDLHRGLNAVLPKDVAIVALEEAAAGFHATYDALGKTYRYQIHNGRVPAVFDRRYTWHYPQPLDAEAMHAAGQALVGTHDFSSFESAGSERPDSVRTITELSVHRGTGDSPGRARLLPSQVDVDGDRTDRVTIEVSGDGFLYNMVRAIVGTLVEVGRGAREINWPAEVLAGCDRTRAGQTAPPQGLFLVRVEY
ncbi:MAG TPA: tRNA pseudouridine(38-40) synthase TruA [Lacipirellulaceae bacterium]|jgi:tRNA pseudouridine38-40 synthase